MKIKKALLIMIGLIMLISAFTPLASAANITVQSGAEEYLFNPTDKDLFEDFKGMMPGDERSQLITIANEKTDTNVTLYMRAEVDQKDKDFLRWYKISVYYTKQQGSEGELIAENIASVEGSLKNDVKLDTLKPGESGYIIVYIKCDKQMSNDYTLKDGTIHWIFSAEEEKVTTKPTTEPTTKPTTQPTTKPTTKPSTTEPTTESTTRPTTQPTTPSSTEPTRPTTKPTTQEPTTKAPTTESPTKKSDIPFTGSSFKPLIIIIPMAVAVVTIIVVLKKKKGESDNNET